MYVWMLSVSRKALGIGTSTVEAVEEIQNPLTRKKNKKL